MQVDQLIAELLAHGDMNDDTTLELNRMLDEWRADRLATDDVDYIVALHARLMHLTPEIDETSSAGASAMSRLDGLTLEDWRDRALRAEAELAQLQEAARNG